MDRWIQTKRALDDDRNPRREDPRFADTEAVDKVIEVQTAIAVGFGLCLLWLITLFLDSAVGVEGSFQDFWLFVLLRCKFWNVIKHPAHGVHALVLVL